MSNKYADKKLFSGPMAEYTVQSMLKMWSEMQASSWGQSGLAQTAENARRTVPTTDISLIYAGPNERCIKSKNNQTVCRLPQDKRHFVINGESMRKLVQMVLSPITKCKRRTVRQSKSIDATCENAAASPHFLHCLRPPWPVCIFSCRQILHVRLMPNSRSSQMLTQFRKKSNNKIVADI